jgi:S-disulfanyl-L-cysteine oxidoreductase SoxD
MSRSRNLALGTALLPSWPPGDGADLGLGRAALPEEIAAWDVAVLPDGTGLKPGSGDVARRAKRSSPTTAPPATATLPKGSTAGRCLPAGIGTLTDPRPVKTIGSYWPYLSTVFDYVHRSMPFGAAQTVSADETYAIALPACIPTGWSRMTSSCRTRISPRSRCRMPKASIPTTGRKPNTRCFPRPLA